MSTFQPGLVHAPLTPFSRDGRIDFGALRKLLSFHLDHGAEALALPMHAGESVSLTDEEQRTLLEFTLKEVDGRVPVLAHVSDSGTGIAASRARHAEAAGAAAIIAATPYYWTPPSSMVFEHLAQIGAAVRIPFFAYYSPDEMGGTKFGTDIVLKLIDRLDNFLGVVDASLDWQFMINVVSNAQRARPAFSLLCGNEYMISAGAIGATGMISSLAGIAPAAVRELYQLCRRERYSEARGVQEEMSALRQILKKGKIAALKGALRAMGRDCGGPRPPNEALAADDYATLATTLGSSAFLRDEPRGW